MNLHLVSDSTGETLLGVARAAAARFEGAEIELALAVFVRSDGQLDDALAAIRAAPGPILHTLTNARHRARLEAVAAETGQRSLAVLDPALGLLSAELGRAPDHRPGMQYRTDTAYFDRIAALDFAIAFDDGAHGERMKRADVILTGVSRTSKTPTCIYLAYRGVKAANMPLVPGREPPPAFFEAMAAGIPVIGLLASPGRLEQIRRERLEAIGDKGHDYATPERIRAEVTESRLFFERHRIPVIDVTRRSIEETAAEILARIRAGRPEVVP